MSELTIAEAHLQAAIMIGLAIQYMFMTWATGKTGSRAGTLTYLAMSLILAFGVIYAGIIILPQFVPL